MHKISDIINTVNSKGESRLEILNTSSNLNTTMSPALRDFYNFSPAEIDSLKLQANEFRRLMAYYNCAMMEIHTKFNVLNEEFSLSRDRNPIASVQSRLKRPMSIKEKIERSGEPLTLESIERTLCDIAGVRVVCPFLDDVYLLENALLAQDDITLVRRKDYIKEPKPNGYRSLHLIVEVPIFLASTKKMMKVEIQIRTIAMDSWATLEHQINYKKDNPYSAERDNELRKCAELSIELDERMENLRRSCLIV